MSWAELGWEEGSGFAKLIGCRGGGKPGTHGPEGGGLPGMQHPWGTLPGRFHQVLRRRTKVRGPSPGTAREVPLLKLLCDF